jgi:hypothetical protein
LISKANIRKHRARIHGKIFQRLISADDIKCQGCGKTYPTRCIRKHEKICKEFHNKKGPINKKRKNLTVLRKFSADSRTFSLIPQSEECYFKAEIKHTFRLLAQGSKISWL